ncbi:hypothetical protein SAMN06264364_1241 [Quadrisphaera granulorum]|uniref:DUF11 domain-containing protein n=1 Tax=Quadrisphaera granulorum TaxID=317664 RepID=A0A315ZWB4_9ACTN|nr:DUF11 domain-containing protein [Quadrisphaera granulorum]PWJ49835.1 hypothetical protein BXY45_1241 [Quadrisphaera granulorum]SZE98043.1 hypothetical protein SAMN06264364_1241 [Quadrisphaera granulorum]
MSLTRVVSAAVSAVTLAVGAVLVSGAASAAGPTPGPAFVSCQNSTPLTPLVDGGLRSASIPFDLSFGGVTRQELWATEDGYVVFTPQRMWGSSYDLTTVVRPLIAPFWADATEYRPSERVYSGTTTFEGYPAMCLSWLSTAPAVTAPSAEQPSNRYQLLLVNRNDRGPGEFDMVFNYDRIQWDETGFYRFEAGATVGWSDGRTGVEFAGSRKDGAFLDSGPRALTKGWQAGDYAPVLGRYVLPYGQGLQPTASPTTAPPTTAPPTTAPPTTAPPTTASPTTAPPKSVVDLRVGVGGPYLARRGGLVAYTVTVLNRGTTTSAPTVVGVQLTGVTVQSTTPPGLADGSVSAGQASVTGRRWAVPALAPGATFTTPIYANASGAGGRPVAVAGAKAVVAPSGPEPELTLVNNVAQAVTVVLP